MIGLELFLAKGGGRTLLIDGDSVHGALTTALLPNRRAASARLLSGESESGLRPLALENGFDFFPAARRSGVGDLLACFKSRDVVRRLGENYDYVLIDLPPMLDSGETAAMVTIASSCVLVAHSSCSSIDDVARGLGLNLLDPEQITTAALISPSPNR